MRCYRPRCNVVFDDRICVMNTETESIVTAAGRFHIIDRVVVQIDAPIGTRDRYGGGFFCGG